MFSLKYNENFSKKYKSKNKFDYYFILKLKFCFGFFSVIFSFLLFIFSLYSFKLFLIFLPFILILYIFLVSVFLNFISKKDLIIKQLFFDYGLKDERDFAKIPVPVIVCNETGDVLWHNFCFKKLVQTKKNIIGLNFKDITKKPLKEFPYKNPEFIEIEGVSFKVYSKYLESSATFLIYLENISEFLSLKREYKISKPCVLYIMVDNYQEIFTNKKDSEKSNLMGKINNVVEEFVDGYFGFMQKYRENEFLVVLEVRHLNNICSGRFKILKDVRDIVNDENFCLTLSIGVGAYGKSLNECARFALEALDMALGRGGDQAAVKTPNNFEFYGGSSKGVEKSTRVRARVISKTLLKLIKEASNDVIMGHKFADLDCVGSSIGLLSTVRKMGKKSFIVIDEEKNLADKLLSRVKKAGFSDFIVDVKSAMEILEYNTLLIIVDTHNPKFLESYEIYESCKNVVVIDHHRKMVDAIKDAVIFYHEPYASSTSELVCEIIQYFGEEYKLKPLEAEALLSGIMLDTKNFTVRVGVRTFEAAVYLKRLGADTVNVRKFFSSSVDLYEKKAKIVVNAKMYKNCAISTTTLSNKYARTICPQAADELLKISDVEASFVIYELEGVVNVTARSLGKFNVQVIMEYLGGGGHQLQAACQVQNSTIVDVKNMLIEAIDRWLS